MNINHIKKVLKGVRGPRGGYSLARERRKISVADIVQVVEAMDAEGEKDSGPASQLAQTVIRPMWEEVQHDMMDRLNKITIEELCRQCADQTDTGTSSKPTDFNI